MYSGLNYTDISRLKNKKTKGKPASLEMAILVCLGLQLTYPESEKMLARAGHILTDSDQDIDYRYLLTHCVGSHSYELRAIQEKIGLKVKKEN